MADQFRCARCTGVFDKSWSDEEAAAEVAERFPLVPLADCTLICDDCYAAFNAWMAKAEA